MYTTMKKLKEIKINKFQLNILLDVNEKSTFEMLLNEGVYCMQCNDICKNGVNNYIITLNSMNDIVVKGECGSCENKVTRVVEFGENRTFFEKALKFRKSIQN